MSAQEEILEKFARAIIDRRFDDARMFLAPWLRDEMDDAALEAAIEQALAAAAEQSGVYAPTWPTEHSLDSNDLEVSELRQNTPSLASAITEANYRGWHCLQFDEEKDAPFDLWVALVEDQGALRLGYLELTPGD
jgi:hypothetical protein